MFDSLKSAASWAASKVEPTTPANGIHVSTETAALAATVSTANLPGFSGAQQVNADTYRNSSNGDTYRVNNSSLAQFIPGASSILGPAKTTEQSAQIAQPTEVSATQTTQPDSIFNLVPAAEWSKVIRDTNAQNQQAGSEHLPTFKLDAAAKVTLTPEQSVKIEGGVNIHTDNDGTVTSQTKDYTKIVHLGHTFLKNVAANTVSDTVDGRVAFSENLNTNSQEWNTKQGVRIVQENNEYKVFDAQGTLIASRPVAQIASELATQATLLNGDHMRRHLGGGAMDAAKQNLASTISTAGVQWNVYEDGVTRTTANGMTAGLMKTGDAFVKDGQITVVRRGRDGKFFVIEGDKSGEIDPSTSKLNATEKTAVLMLSRIGTDGKLHLGDGTFLTIKDGQVVGGEDQIVDEPVVAPSKDSGPITDEPVVEKKSKQVEVAMVTSGDQTSSAVLKGGFHEKYDWKSHCETISNPTPISQDTVAAMVAATAAPITDAPIKDEPIVKFEDTKEGPKVTTADVITTKEGTVDRVTGDKIGAQGTIDTTDGIHVSANNDVHFADGTTFSHDGTVTLSDGRVLSGAKSNDAMISAAAAAAVSAAAAAESIAARIGSGKVTMADIAALQSAISGVNALINVCMNAGNLEVAQSLMSTGGTLEGALSAATASFTSNTTFRATGLQTVGSPNQQGKYSSMQYKFAA